MNKHLSDAGSIHCEVAVGIGRHWILCARMPRWRLSSTINAAVVTHCCDQCLNPFLEPYERDNWAIESLTLQSWSN